jgi:hypothetical protein
LWRDFRIPEPRVDMHATTVCTFSWLDDELLICPNAIDDGLRRTFSALLRRSPNF